MNKKYIRTFLKSCQFFLGKLHKLGLIFVLTGGMSFSIVSLENRKQFICGYKYIVEYVNSLISLDHFIAITYREKLEDSRITQEEKIDLISILMRYRLLPINEKEGEKCRFFSYLCLPQSPVDALYNLASQYLQKYPSGPAFCHIYYNGAERLFPLLSKECKMAIEKRIQAIPTPLAIAQGGLESAWGTSYFSENGNNFYGIQTTLSSSVATKNNSKCILARRNSRKCVYNFSNIEMNYFIYAQTLNSLRSYISLRELRYQSLSNGDTPCETSLNMANGLSSYATDKKYVPKVKSLVKKICQIIDNC